MGFDKKTWKDRDVQYPGKRTLTNVDDNADFQDVIVERAEGTVAKAGDLYCASVMNDLEQRIADAFAEIMVDIDAEFDLVYPIGSIYQSFKSISPETLFPGTTWKALYDTQDNVGRLLLPVSTSESSGQKRGNNKYILSSNYTSKSISVTGTVAKTALALNQMPKHTHDYTGNSGTNMVRNWSSYGIWYNYYFPVVGYAGKSYGHDHPFSGTGTFTEKPVSIDIRQPYITMYAWRRTA